MDRRTGAWCGLKPFAALGGLVTFPVLALWLLAEEFDWRYVVGYVSLVSAATFVTYGWDKARARKGEWRVSEARLHLLELAGGWAAGFVAQRYFRHKTSKTSYLVVFWLIVVAHEAVAVDYVLGWPFVSAVRGWL